MKREPAPLLDLRLLGRHQVAAAVATGIDFATMIALVELAGMPPPYATIASAAAGGLANFTLGRTWAFRGQHRGTLLSQAVRYGIVCAGGALLNGSLLAAALAVVGAGKPPAAASYIVARALVSLLVSVVYTYPIHTRFVFRAVQDLPSEPAEQSQPEAAEMRGAA